MRFKIVTEPLEYFTPRFLVSSIILEQKVGVFYFAHIVIMIIGIASFCGGDKVKLLVKMKLLTFISALLPIMIIYFSAPHSLWKNAEFNQTVAIGVGAVFTITFLLPSLSVHWLALGSLMRIKGFCNQVKQGDYRTLANLPNENDADEENEFISLMRDMNWMVHKIKNREREMAELIIKLDLAKSDLLFQKKALETANVHLKEMAMTDALTGLSNRRHFFQHLRQELCRRRKNKETLSLLVIDIDFFKRVNDSYGHQIGDLVIKKFGGVLKKTARKSDLAARLGGEEFAVLMPETSREEAVKMALLIKSRIADYAFEDGQGATFRVTCSIGIFCDDSLFGKGENILYGYADQALYEAKHSGRNCIVYWDEKTGHGEKISA